MSSLVNQNGTWVVGDDVDLTNFGLNEIDLTDGSWTLIDINSGIKTVAMENKAVKVSTNVIAQGNINQANNSLYYAPRWFRLLKDENGNQITQNDNYILIVTHQAQSSSNPPAFGLAVGTAVNPFRTGSNSETNQCFTAGALLNDSNGNNTHFSQQVIGGASAIGSNKLTTSSINRTVLNFNGKNGSISSVASSTSTNAAARVDVPAPGFQTGSQNVYLQIGLASRYASTSCSDGQIIKQIIQYKVIKLGN